MIMWPNAALVWVIFTEIKKPISPASFPHEINTLSTPQIVLENENESRNFWQVARKVYFFFCIGGKKKNPKVIDACHVMESKEGGKVDYRRKVFHVKFVSQEIAL
uniref:Uncharacterized protein n=1 Tax=Cacopsylla melanoneura TaxID=428564 RepID=A0A8D9A2G1_9HEMI